jgi:hypothetical protein
MQVFTGGLNNIDAFDFQEQEAKKMLLCKVGDS